MPFYARAADFLTDRVAPRLTIGRGPRNLPTRADLEAQAHEELQARIERGRPGPEESTRRGPAPDWAVARPTRPTRPLDAVAVRLDVLDPAAAESRPAPARRPRVARS